MTSQLTARDYMTRPCNMHGESLRWAVLGGSRDGMSGGVLAWCWDETDARHALAAIRSEGDYVGLTIEELVQ